MAFAAHRWITTAPDAPLVRAALKLMLDGGVALEPRVEPHPLDDRQPVFEAVHSRDVRRCAPLVP